MSSIQASADNMARRSGNFCGKPLLAEIGSGKLVLTDARDGGCHVRVRLGMSLGVTPYLVEEYGRVSHTGLSHGEVLKILLDSKV